jgi:hypothetical protein
MPGRGIRLLPMLRYGIVALEVLSSRLRVPHEVASLAAVEAFVRASMSRLFYRSTSIASAHLNTMIEICSGMQKLLIPFRNVIREPDFLARKVVRQPGTWIPGPAPKRSAVASNSCSKDNPDYKLKNLVSFALGN